MKVKEFFKTKIFKFTPLKTIVLSFVLLILLGTFLLCLPISHTNGQWFNFTDALFTSTSSVCVTGLSVVDMATNFTLFGEFVILLLIQIGGLGFVSITCLMFMILGKKIDYATRMTLQESLNKETTQGVVKMVKKILIVVFVSELIGFVVLAPSLIIFSNNFWLGCFQALFLAVSSFCSAGIDPLGTLTPDFSNISAFSTNAFVLIPILLLVFTGSIGFVVLFEIFDFKRKQKLSLHTKIVLSVTLILMLSSALIFACFEWNNPETIGNMPWGYKILNCLFQSIIPSNAGFSTFNIANMHSVSLFVTGFLMMVGGSPMGLAGGIKTTTLFVLILATFKRPFEDGSIDFKNRSISVKTINKSVRLALLFVSLTAISSILIALFELNSGIGFTAIVFECISAISTGGMSLGATPLLGAISKYILLILMFIGRIGMLTLPLIFKQNQTIANEIEYPDSKIIVG